MRTRLVITLCLTLGAGSACDRKKSEPDPPPQPAASVDAEAPTPAVDAAPEAGAEKPTRPTEPLNVVLLTVDSMRADMPWAGYERKIAPNLTELAKESVVYTNAYSVSSYTAKSVGALLTGRYPSSLYRSGVFFTTYSKANVFLTEILQKSGIRTMGLHSHLYFGRGKNLEQGFDVWELVPGITFDAQTDKHVTSEKMTQAGIEMLGKPENTKGQFFAWFHYMDPHDVYVKHDESPDFGKTNRDRYDSEIFYTDLWIGKLLDFMKKQPWWERTALIVSADHGEAFGEHSMWKHAFHVWEVLTRVPILVHAPGIEPRRIDERRSHIDLAPTVLDLMGQEAPDFFVGKTLVPEVYGAKPDDREPIVLDLPADTNNPPVRAVIQGDWKIIVHGKGWKRELYRLTEDPGEEKDLAKSQPDELERMKKLYEETWAEIPFVKPYGGNEIKSGGVADGPMGPPKTPEKDPKSPE